MTEKEMKRLNRAELLELLLEQTKETERLQKKLEKTESMLADRYLRVQKAGDLAHAVLEINGVVNVVQIAAQQYLDNIAKMEEETRAKCEQLLAEARAEAARIRQPESAEKENADPEVALLTELNELLEEENG